MVVNIQTLGALDEATRNSILPVDDVWKLADLKRLQPYDEKIQEIIQTVENVTGGYGWVSPKFDDMGIGNRVLHWDYLSTGCKTVILALYYSTIQENNYLNISETGPVALRETISILNDHPQIIGVISQPLRLDGDNATFNLCVNNCCHKNWISVFAALRKEGV